MIHQDTATILQAQWAEIGVDVTLEEVDAGALFDRYLASDWEIAIRLPHFTADVTVNDEVETLFWDNNPENVIRAFADGLGGSAGDGGPHAGRRGRPTRRSGRSCGRRCSRSPWTMRRG